MQYFDRINVSEAIDVNEISASKECDICNYSYFWNTGFKFKPNVSNRCHDIFMSTNLGGIAI